VDQHEIDVLAGVALRNLVKLGYEEGVAGDVDAVWKRLGGEGCLKVW